jgi:hypothetical protein
LIGCDVIFNSTFVFLSHHQMVKIAFLLASAAALVSARSIRLAPLMVPANGKIIPNEYIVQLTEPEFGINADGAYPELVRGKNNSLLA